MSQLLSLNPSAAECGWDQAVLQGVFLKKLSEEIKDELAARDETTSLEELIKLATQLDSWFKERQREKEREKGREPVPSPRL